jgi:glycosyl transferase family 87
MRARLAVIFVVLGAALCAPPGASAVESFASEPPFGGAPLPPLHRVAPHGPPPAGFRLVPARAIAAARGAGAVLDESAQHAALRPRVYTRGDDEWEVDFYAGGERVAAAVIVDASGEVLGAWHDQQLDNPLARGYSGAIAQKVNAPYVWLLLSVLFVAPFFDPRRLLRAVHADLLVLLGLGVSLFFFNRGEITLSVPLTYPVLGYFLLRMLAAGLWPRERAGPLVPLVPIRWLAWAAVGLAAARVALNVLDSHVIDIGVAGVIGADHLAHGQELYSGAFSPGVHLRGDVYGPFNYLAYLPFELLWPWHGTWGSVPAAHAAAIAFDLLTALGLTALGRRLRAGEEGRALGVAMAFAWLACPWTLYAMNANANDGLVAALSVGAMLALASPAGRGIFVALAAAAKFGPAALAPLFAAGTGGRRLRSVAVFGLVFVAVVVVLFAPFVPSGGIHELYDRTLGYQASRSSPFSIWGLAPSLDFLRSAARAGAILLALGVAIYPRSRSPLQVAALAAAVTIAVQLGATHWFYFYVVWFLPFALVASFGEQRRIAPAVRPGGFAARRAAAS